MKVGDMVKLCDSTRKNGPYAGKVGLIVGLDVWENPTVSVGSVVKSFHYSQIEKVLGTLKKESSSTQHRAPSIERPVTCSREPGTRQSDTDVDTLSLLVTNGHT